MSGTACRECGREISSRTAVLCRSCADGIRRKREAIESYPQDREVLRAIVDGATQVEAVRIGRGISVSRERASNIVRQSRVRVALVGSLSEVGDPEAMAVRGVK